MSRIEHDSIFVALTRPQMLAGVSYSFAIVNAVVATELFLIFRSAWVIALALLFHGVGAAMSLREPRFVDLWLTKVRRCPRVRNHSVWRCNSYLP